MEIKSSIDIYKIGKTIGEGTFGKVKSGINSVSNETVSS
jgi:hypothetical protein